MGHAGMQQVGHGTTLFVALPQKKRRAALALLGRQSVEELQLLATVVRPMLDGLPLRLQHHGRPVA